jgi:hypothetical protein
MENSRIGGAMSDKWRAVKGLREKYSANGVGLRPESLFYDEAKACAGDSAQVVPV